MGYTTGAWYAYLDFVVILDYHASARHAFP